MFFLGIVPQVNLMRSIFYPEYVLTRMSTDRMSLERMGKKIQTVHPLILVREMHSHEDMLNYTRNVLYDEPNDSSWDLYLPTAEEAYVRRVRIKKCICIRIHLTFGRISPIDFGNRMHISS